MQDPQKYDTLPCCQSIWPAQSPLAETDWKQIGPEQGADME